MTSYINVSDIFLYLKTLIDPKLKKNVYACICNKGKNVPE